MALSFGRFQFFYFCCVGRSVIDVLSDFQLHSLTFVECFGNDTQTRSNVFRWHERFTSGRESVEDDERSGRLSAAKTDENINKIKGWMTASRKLTIREIGDELNIASDPLKIFCLMIWASDVSLQSWCRET